MSLEADYIPDVMDYCDFSGYVVKYDVMNEDGYSIAKNAFKELDNKTITIVNNFYEGIYVGVCLLNSDDIGLYGRCFLKNNPYAKDVLQEVREGMVDAFVVNLESVIIDTKDPKTVLNGSIKNIMMDQHENGKYVSSIDFIKDYVPDEETIAEYVERTTPDKPLKYEPEIDDKIPDFVNKEIKRSMKEAINKEYYKKVTDNIKDPHNFHALPWTVDVLGTRYNIKSVDRNTDDKRLDGANAYCDYYAKEIVAIKYEETEKSFKDIHAFNRKTLRHEIIHAFLAESGLRRNCNWACEEEMVDWIAIQFPKIFKAFKEAGALNSEDLK